MSNPFKNLSFSVPVTFLLWSVFIWLFLFLSTNAAHAADLVQNADGNYVYKSYPKALELTFDAALVADLLTTLDIKEHPGKIQESNPLLGKHPGDAKVLGYFAGCAVLHALVTKELVDNSVPSAIVRGWEYVSIGVEVGQTARNYSIGLRFKL